LHTARSRMCGLAEMKRLPTESRGVLRRAVALENVAYASGRATERRRDTTIEGDCPLGTPHPMHPWGESRDSGNVALVRRTCYSGNAEADTVDGRQGDGRFWVRGPPMPGDGGMEQTLWS